MLCSPLPVPANPTLQRYLTLILDTYWGCDFKGPDALCFYGSRPIFGHKFTDAQIFFVWWCFALVWNLINFFFGPRMRNFFRTECPLNEATSVYVKVKTEKNVTVVVNKVVELSRKLAGYIFGEDKFSYYEITVPVKFKWNTTVAALDAFLARPWNADGLGLSPAVIKALTSDGLTTTEDLRFVQADDLVKLGVKLIQARKIIDRIGQQFEDTAMRSIDVLCKRYSYNYISSAFEPALVDMPSSFSALRSLPGLASADATGRLNKIGANDIAYKVEPWGKLISEELNSYLYLYQFTIYSLWLWFSALVWGAPQVILVLVSAVISVVFTRKGQQLIAKITENHGEVTVLRDGVWQVLDNSELAPGDRIKLTARDWTLPCDAVLVQGTCVTDESGLTGESMPVSKIEFPVTDGTYSTNVESSNHLAKHTLYAGTILRQAGAGGAADGSEKSEVHAIVTQTGIRTFKGELISHILFPNEMVFQYDEELRVVFMLLVVYALFLFAISVWLQIKIAPLTWVSIFSFALFTVSQILPPLLPIALVVGHQMSAKRLRAKQIQCVNPKRIAIAGKIHVFMFDKTGTLTKQGLDFLGVRSIEGGKFANGKKQGKEVAGTKMGQAMATCHAVTKMDTSTGTIFVGNQVEVKMFESCGCNLVEEGGKAAVTKNKATGEELTIEKRFEFDHHTMTMSVLVRDSKGDVHVFCKGSPEAIAQLCDPSTITADFEQTYKTDAMEGCYVIGMSTRSLGNVDAKTVAHMERSEVEANGSLTCLGLMLFRNELKEDTAGAIEELREGDVRSVMVTGDNAQCGFYIASTCNILKPETKVYLGEPNADNVVTWKIMEKAAGGGPQAEFSTDEILELCKLSRGAANTTSCDTPDIELAITGKALRLLDHSKTGTGEIDGLLLNTRIFARVKPDQKVLVVKLHADRGLITGMCGDGGNDCGALRAAHAGIALSDAEASVVSPFTSGTKSVQSVVHLLQEGRCALATSFAAYRFYITYGLNWSIVKTINFVYGVRMPITGYLTIDSILSWLVAWAITLALPLNKLTAFRPTTSLFNVEVMLSTLCPWAMWMLLMGGVLVMQQNHKDHVPFPAHLTKGCGYWQLGDNWEATVFTTFMVFPLVWSGIVYSLGSKFRRLVFWNFGVCIVFLIIFILYTALLLSPVNDSTAIFHVASNAFNGRNTASPVMMRFQFPQGCYMTDAKGAYMMMNNATAGAQPVMVKQPTIALARAQAGGYTPNNCDAIDKYASAKSCGPACARQNPPYGDATNGMSMELRTTIFGIILAGMAATLIFQNVLNFVFVKTDPLIGSDVVVEVVKKIPTVRVGAKKATFGEEAKAGDVELVESVETKDTVVDPTVGADINV